MPKNRKEGKGGRDGGRREGKGRWKEGRKQAGDRETSRMGADEGSLNQCGRRVMVCE